MTERKKIIWITVSLLFLILMSLLGFMVYKHYSEEDKAIWSQNKTESFTIAETNQKPILIAFVEFPCGEEPESNPCPQAASIPELKDFVLLEVIKNSQEFIEFSYDDRFLAEQENLPKFVLLNSSGELRDIQNTFPKGQLLERWKNIR